MASKWNGGFTDTTWGDNDILNAADLNDTFKDIVDNVVHIRRKSSGTITIQAATIGYDTDFADISFSANELAVGDVILLYLNGDNDGNKNSICRIDLESTTTNTTGEDFNVGQAATAGGVTVTISQLRSDTSMVYVHIVAIMEDDATETEAKQLESGDDNVFTTAFDIRINTKQNASSTGNTTVQYLMVVLKST